LEPGKEANIVGLQGCMWSEENISEEFMWIKIFPQLAAVAERGWREGMVSFFRN